MTIDSSLATTQHTGDQQARQLSRWAAWCVCTLVLFAYVTVLVLPLPPGARTLWLAYLYLVPSALAIAAGAFVLALGVDARERPFWIWLVAATTAFLVGDAYFAWRQTTAVGAGSVQVSDALLLCGYCLLVAALLTWSSLGSVPGRARRGPLLDLVAVSGSAFVVFFGFGVAPPGAASSAAALTLLLGILFAVADTALATAMAAAVLGFKTAPWRPWQMAVGAAVAAMLAGDLFALFGSTGSYFGVLGQVAKVSGVAWVVAYLALFVAGSLRLFEQPTGETALARSATPMHVGWRAFAGPGLVLVAVPLMMLASHRAGVPSLLVMGAVGAVVGAAVVARVMLGTAEIDRLHEAVTSDEVTGLHNARFLREMLADRIAAADLAGDSLTLAFIDLDGLDVINEAVGHKAGDGALKELGRIVVQGVGSTDRVARIDGGRFAAVFTAARSFDAYVSCRTILERAGRDPGLDAVASVSCGLAAYPEHAASALELMDRADIAARTAARRGGGTVTSFDPNAMAEDRKEREQADRADPVRTLQSLAGAIDASDPDTKSHSANVSLLAAALGARIGLDSLHVERLRVAGTLHDVGKVGIPEEVLHKPGSLSEPEVSAMRSHPELGSRMLQATEAAELAPWVRAHHERWDGAGYPDGTAGSAIPIAARIISVADAYDAMTSPRPWREAFSVEHALGQLAAGAGGQFDPRLVAEFSTMIQRDGDPRLTGPKQQANPAKSPAMVHNIG